MVINQQDEIICATVHGFTETGKKILSVVLGSDKIKSIALVKLLRCILQLSCLVDL